VAGVVEEAVPVVPEDAVGSYGLIFAGKLALAMHLFVGDGTYVKPVSQHS
jgi:hypothetical protein